MASGHENHVLLRLFLFKYLNILIIKTTIYISGNIQNGWIGHENAGR